MAQPSFDGETPTNTRKNHLAHLTQNILNRSIKRFFMYNYTKYENMGLM
jgi:hypothetical protein